MSDCKPLLAIVTDGLEKIVLPPLVRPSVPNDKPNEALVLWESNYYNYCVIAHLRVVLRGIVDLIKVGNIPTAFVACRHVYEWTAHACYMSKNLGDHMAKQEWAEADSCNRV